MKKIFALFFIFFTITIIFAHPPSNIIITYDNANDSINVVVKHNILDSKEKDPNTHYINSIDLTINGKAIKTNTFTKQDTVEEQTTTFDKLNLDKNKDNEIEIEAYCSISGEKNSSIVVKSMKK